MRICEEVDFNDLMNKCWSGAIDTLNTIYNNDKENAFMDLLEETYYSEVPTLTEINDLLWFEDEWIFEILDINPESDDDEEEYDEDEEEDFDDD